MGKMREPAKRRRWGRPSLILFGLVLAFLLAEVGLRISFYQNQRKQIAAWQKVAENVAQEAKGPLTLGQILRLSLTDDIIYELLPNLDATFRDQGLKTNSLGFRGAEVEIAAAPQTIRILGIGDSVMFGYGVAQEHTYLSWLERRLNLDYAPIRFEVINSAVPGYNAAMELATLETKGLSLKPDLVLLHSVANDYGLPNYIAEPVNFAAVDQSYLLKFLRDSNAFQHAGLLENIQVRPHFYESDPARAPAPYKHLVGRQAYARAITRLKELSRQYQFETFAIYKEEYIGMEEILKRNEIAYMPYKSVVDAAQAASREPEFAGSSLSVSKADIHPSGRGHYVIAAAVYAELHRTGLIQRLIARKSN